MMREELVQRVNCHPRPSPTAPPEQICHSRLGLEPRPLPLAQAKGWLRLATLVLLAAVCVACDSSPTGPSDNDYDQFDRDEDDDNGQTDYGPDDDPTGPSRPSLCDVERVDSDSIQEDADREGYYNIFWNMRFRCFGGANRRRAYIVVAARLWSSSGRLYGEGTATLSIGPGDDRWLCAAADGCPFFPITGGRLRYAEIPNGQGWQWRARWETCESICPLPDPPATPDGLSRQVTGSQSE